MLDTDADCISCMAEMHSAWIWKGHHIREQIGNDDLTTRFLRHILPKYEGPSMQLYRGENVDRWENQIIGFSWTPKIKTATMFARGLQARGKGGVLLSCACKADWIISGPNKHSEWLAEQEYTLEPGLLRNIETIGSYPPID